MKTNTYHKVLQLILTFILMASGSFAQIGNYKSYDAQDHSVVFESVNGGKIRIQFYTNQIIRVQYVQAGEDFFANDHYEMVENHDLKGNYSISENKAFFSIISGGNEAVTIFVRKKPLMLEFVLNETEESVLIEKSSPKWEGNTISCHFDYDPDEHFCGMGHPAFGMVESIDLRGKSVSCNYGEGEKTEWGLQGILTVPFFISSKGYGLFLNSSYEHHFVFGKNQNYEFDIDTKGFEGRMDYFFIAGPEFASIIDRYTQLTGRPRLPMLSMFGLLLSDKGYPQNDGAEWWKTKIQEHYDAGFPLDHIVNDNRWRAGTGAWSGSWFQWDSIRYPHPEAYQKWIEEMGLTLTLDFNRNNAAASSGWKESYNIPTAKDCVKEGFSTPDYSNPEVRNWIWTLFWEQSLNPALGYPGDALWIDETDELWPLSDSVILYNGWSWAETENYYPFLIAKAIVQEGWDNENKNTPPGIEEAKRPFVWMRSMTAGAQRYATHWSGDLECDYEWMKGNIRAMQTSGLSGFPYFNHDAGGFRWPGPTDDMYINWAMAFGSFSPIWRPHGIGELSRWPLDRSKACQQAAHKYGQLRYQLMAYIYSYAHIAHHTGMPMARAMVIDFQDEAKAWEYDLQYMWGNELLVAPKYFANDTIMDIWLPKAYDWYNYWTDDIYHGDQVIAYQTKMDEMPVFVKAGAIIPQKPYSKNTRLLEKRVSEDMNIQRSSAPYVMTVDVYLGADGEFFLYEDDGISEKFRTQHQIRITRFSYEEAKGELIIHPSQGDYENSIKARAYRVVFHGLKSFDNITVNHERIRKKAGAPDNSFLKSAYYYKDKKDHTVIYTPVVSIDTNLMIQLNKKQNNK